MSMQKSASGGKLRFNINERAGNAQIPIERKGNTVQLVDETGIRAALTAVHTESDGNNDWCLLGYKSKGIEQLHLLGSGSGGPDALAEHLHDDMVGYALVRVTDMVDESVRTTRFIYLVWIGDRVPAVTKGRIGTQKHAITLLIGHYSVEVVASTKAEVSKDTLMGVVQDASGSRSRVTATPKSGKAAKHRAVNSAVPRTNESVSFEDEAALRAAIRDVRSDGNDINWCVCGIEGRSTTVRLVGTGSGGVEDIKQHLKPGSVNYVLLRIDDKIDESAMKRFVYIEWVGTKVPMIVKGKISTLKGTMDDVMSPYHFKVYGDDPGDVTPAAIAAGLQQLKGSKGGPVGGGGRGKAIKAKAPEYAKHVPRSVGAVFADEPGMRAAIRDVRSDANDVNWAVFRYDGKQVRLEGSGGGDVNALKPLLTPTTVNYALLRIDDKIDASAMKKFVCIEFVGAQVSALVKGKVSTLKGAMDDLCSPYHFKVFGDEPDDITSDAIAKGLAQLKGGKVGAGKR